MAVTAENKPDAPQKGQMPAFTYKVEKTGQFFKKWEVKLITENKTAKANQV